MDRLIEKVVSFRDERNWRQFHNPKDLAISLSLEASELLENFQWKSSKEAIDEKGENIKEELADIVIYCCLLANELEINIEEAVLTKLDKGRKKYPVEKAYGSRKKYNEL